VTRDNFPTPVKTALAKRAGYRCSYPGCNAITVGPSEECQMAVANTGTAAHISAAAGGKGSRRFDQNMTEEQRTSIENGIWCCRDHGTLIDADEVTYSSTMLRSWRAIAEKKAQIRQAHGSEIKLIEHPDLAKIGLAPDCLTLDGSFVNTAIGNAVVLSCISEIWGKEVADSARDFLIEYSRNCFQHAHSTTVAIEFVGNGITVCDDGMPFDLHTLAQPDFGRGGGLAYRALLSKLRINAISTSTSASNSNVLTIPLVKDSAGLLAHNPCAVAISHEQLRSNNLDFSVFSSCSRAYVVAPDFMTYSDGPRCESVLEAAMKEHQNVVLVIPQASLDVIEDFRKRFPRTEVMSW